MSSISQDHIFNCCSCTSFAATVAQRGPYNSIDELIGAARNVWWNETPVTGWLEAFAAHPKIGDIDNLKKKYGTFAALSTGEQAQAATASTQTLQDLAHWNKVYEEKFGHIFIVCASGKSAEEMLHLIQARYPNDPATELTIAAIEQQKITELRLAKVLGPALQSPVERRTGQLVSHLRAGSGTGTHTAITATPSAASSSSSLRSPITSHVLDTCLGKPAQGVRLSLQRLAPGSGAAWEHVAVGATNEDGRALDLLPPSSEVQAGRYRIMFDTDEYMKRCRDAHPGFFADRPFYPSVVVTFEITPEQTRQHFHVPLTWNPYGYSTYRGS